MSKEKFNQYKDRMLEMAIDDFEKFCNYAGVDKKQLAVCIEIEKGNSLQQISNKLSIPKSTVRNVRDKCFPCQKTTQNSK